MKRIITVTVTVITAAAVLLGLAATSSAAIPVPGTNCSFSVQYLPDPDLTTMYFSYSNGLFQTPLARSGACGHAYVESLGVAAVLHRSDPYIQRGPDTELRRAVHAMDPNKPDS